MFCGVVGRNLLRICVLVGRIKFGEVRAKMEAGGGN